MTTKSKTKTQSVIPPCPISGLGLKNFRSIEEADVQIKPLTVVVGGNSAGKSSILSALRLLKQAQGSGERNHVFPLDGIEIELGQFSDLCRQGSDDQLVEITLRCDVDEQAGFRRGLADVFSPFPPTGLKANIRIVLGEDQAGAGKPTVGMASVKELEVRVMNGTSEIEYLSLTASEVKTEFPDPPQDSFVFRFATAKAMNPARNNQFRFVWDLPEGTDFPLVGNLTNLRSGSTLTTFCRLTSGGIPSLLEVDSTPAEVLRACIRRVKALSEDQINDALRQRRFRTTPRGRNSANDQSEVQYTQDLISRLREPGSLRKVSQGDFEEIIDLLMPGIRNADQLRQYLGSLDEDRIIHSLDNADSGWKQPISYVVTSLQASTIPSVLEQISRVLQVRMSHMGPLRQGPRRLYSFGERASANELGREAQYFAYTLRNNKDVQVNRFDGNSSQSGPASRFPLTDALSYWAKYLKVADSIDVEELPGFGRKVKVLLPGLNRAVDWDQVGVGVSQILPVLLKVLLSPAGSLTLIEQPELHLHPDAQAALADFLLSAASHGRNLIIETHSDALLTRIRKRVVEESLENRRNTAKRVTFIYANRDEVSGVSTLRNVDLTDTGGFFDWPQGFADQTFSEARDLLEKQIALAEAQTKKPARESKAREK